MFESDNHFSGNPFHNIARHLSVANASTFAFFFIIIRWAWSQCSHYCGFNNNKWWMLCLDVKDKVPNFQQPRAKQGLHYHTDPFKPNFSSTFSKLKCQSLRGLWKNCFYQKASGPNGLLRLLITTTTQPVSCPNQWHLLIKPQATGKQAIWQKPPVISPCTSCLSMKHILSQAISKAKPWK